jgi:hypothetical protein
MADNSFDPTTEEVVDGMNETIVVGEETTEEVAAVEQKVEAKKEDLHKSAGYFARHPEELEKLLTDVEKIGTKKKAPVAKASNATEENQTAQELRELKLELAKEKAINKYGLDEEELRFLKANDPEELLELASEFSEYKKKSGRIKEEGNDEGSNSPATKYQRTSSTAPVTGRKQTLDELENELRNTKFTLQ